MLASGIDALLLLWHLVRRRHFRSRDKNGAHIIWSTVAENPILHANIMTVCFIERQLLTIIVLPCGNRNFRLFGSCDLDLDPMTFVYELDPYFLEIYRVCENELRKSRLSKVIVLQTCRLTEWKTRLKLYTTQLRGWSKLYWLVMHSRRRYMCTVYSWMMTSAAWRLYVLNKRNCTQFHSKPSLQNTAIIKNCDSTV